MKDPTGQEFEHVFRAALNLFHACDPNRYFSMNVFNYVFDGRMMHRSRWHRKNDGPSSTYKQIKQFFKYERANPLSSTWFTTKQLIISVFEPPAGSPIGENKLFWPRVQGLAFGPKVSQRGNFCRCAKCEQKICC